MVPFARWGLLGLALLLTPAGPARCATPRDELLRLVPEDVGFCLIVQDLRAHHDALHSSPFYDALQKSPAGKPLREASQLVQLLNLDDIVRKALGLGLDDLRNDVLGDALVFAYRPGPPGKPEDEQGLILIRARKARSLHDMVEYVNASQKKAGTLRELEELTHNGVKYYRRLERTEPEFYYLRGPVLVLSGQEDMLRQAIDRDRLAPADDEPPIARRLRDLGVDRALFTLWLNPRAFDAEVEARAAQANEASASGLKTVAAYWKALDGAALTVVLERDLKFNLAVRARTTDLPAAAQRFLASASRPAEIARRFPDNALIALSGRLDLAALLDAMGDFMSKESRDALHRDLNLKFGAHLGKDVIKEVLPHVGPDWGAYLAAPPAGAAGCYPQGLLAVRVAPGDETAPVDKALLSSVDFLANLAVLAYNKQHPDQQLSLKRSVHDKTEVRYLVSEKGLPPGVQPAFALAGGYLLLASSPDAIHRFAAAPASAPDPSAPVPILRISAKAWRAYIGQRREALADVLAELNQLKRDEVLQRLDNVVAALQLVDRIEISHRSAPGQAIITLTVQTALPLKK
jgi:hypothetical protein